MWTVFVLMNFLGFTCTVASFPPSPINVSFSSVNLRNVLHWLPGHDSPNDTQYKVQYAIYGENVDRGKQVKWREVRQCTAIMRTWCDLSAQTSDLEDWYYARVRSVVRRIPSKWTSLQNRFEPKDGTSLGPPLVSVEAHNNTATIILKGPMRYQLNNQTPAISMAKIYPEMTYNLSIHNTHLDQMHHYVVQKSLFKYRLLNYNTKYCFSAQSRLLLMPNKCLQSAWYCITTGQDPLIEQLQRVVVGIVVPFLLICVIVVAGFMLYHYMAGKEEKSPSVLNKPFDKYAFFQSSDQTSQSCHVTQDNGTPKQPPLCPPDHSLDDIPPPSYFPQSPEEPEEPQDDSSVEYGAVCVKKDSNVQGGLSYRPQESSRRCTSANLPPHLNEGINVLSGYAPQNPGNLPTSHSNPSDYYDVMEPHDMPELESEDGDNEMEGLPFLSEMSVESRRLQQQSREEGNLAAASEERETGNHLEPYVTKGVINMEDVFLEQNFETDWAENELEEDSLARWHLIIAMN